MLRRFVLALLLGSLGGAMCLGLGGCSKPALPDTTVRAATTEDLAAFRADLGERFTAEQLQPFDTALLELKLDAMNRGVAAAADREQQVQAAVNGQTVRAVEILGWKARRTRLLGEITFMSGLMESDLKAQQRTAATGTPASVTTHIQNEQDILARLHRDLTATEQELTGLAAP
ncbi:MAG: hypothetical protein ACHQ5A_05755 [Opitutales bacterium]